MRERREKREEKEESEREERIKSNEKEIGEGKNLS